MDDDARQLIAALDLAPHPEGGWFRETWRESGEGRGLATAIYFLLEAGQSSHWHRVDATELWLFHAGTPPMLSVSRDEKGPIEHVRVGPDVIAGDRPQAIVPKGWWQAAAALEGWALISCVVSPAFQFEGFELAPPGWSPANEKNNS
jgi:predicted cupin superfamily sugar epimerase